MNSLISAFHYLILLFSLSTIGFTQPIPRISLWGQKIVPLLLAFDAECIRGSYKGNGSMGIYRIDRYAASTNSPERWLVTLIIDDRYKKEPPKEYTQIGERVYFFYDDVEDRRPIVNPSSPTILAYQDELIADRLYIRPVPKQRYTEHRINGKIVREEIEGAISGGYPAHSIWFTFMPDGTIAQSRSFRD